MINIMLLKVNRIQMVKRKIKKTNNNIIEMQKDQQPQHKGVIPKQVNIYS